MATEQEIAEAMALLAREGYSVQKPTDNDWRRFGAVITCNMIAPGLTEKKFVDMIQSALRMIFVSRGNLSRALGHDIVQMGPLNVKSYTRVRAGLRRKGEDIADG